MIRVLLPALLALGCASTPYAFAPHGETDLTLELREGEPQIERGVPNAWVDGFGHYFFSLPSKLILLNWKVDNHDISDEVEQSLEQYLHANGLCNTKVRLNQYAPGGEWQRLFRNQEMPAGWRYTFGIISVSLYTIFPERLLAGFPFIGGGDHYNPYTNTVSIYSGSRPIVIHEGGHAKDFAGKENRQWKGAYAGLRGIPLLGIPFTLWQEGVASSDALSWDLATAGSRESKSAYRTLYPAYGTYLGGTAPQIAFFVGGGPIIYAIQYGIVAVGHVVGQTRALFVEQRAGGIEPGAIDGPGAVTTQTASLEDLPPAPFKCPIEESEEPPPSVSEPAPDDAIPPPPPAEDATRMP